MHYHAWNYFLIARVLIIATIYALLIRLNNAEDQLKAQEVLHKIEVTNKKL